VAFSLVVESNFRRRSQLTAAWTELFEMPMFFGELLVADLNGGATAGLFGGEPKIDQEADGGDDRDRQDRAGARR